MLLELLLPSQAGKTQNYVLEKYATEVLENTIHVSK